MGGEDGGNHQETTFDPFDQPRINSFLSKPSPWAWCFLQTRTDNKSSRSIYLVLRSLSTGHLNPGLNQPPINRYARPMTQEHTNLHHPPIRDRRHFQTPLKNCDLEDRHPTEQPNLEEYQRKRVGLEGSIDNLRTILICHRCDREILEDDAECKGKTEVDEHFSPKETRRGAEGCICTVNEPFANDIAQYATCTAVTDSHSHRHEHWTPGILVMVLEVFALLSVSCTLLLVIFVFRRVIVLISFMLSRNPRFQVILLAVTLGIRESVDNVPPIHVSRCLLTSCSTNIRSRRLMHFLRTGLAILLWRWRSAILDIYPQRDRPQIQRIDNIYRNHNIHHRPPASSPDNVE